jgi:hypothetical protein
VAHIQVLQAANPAEQTGALSANQNMTRPCFE